MPSETDQQRAARAAMIEDWRYGRSGGRLAEVLAEIQRQNEAGKKFSQQQPVNG